LTSKATLRNPSSLAMAAGEPGTEPGRTKLKSSSRAPVAGRRQHDELGAGAGNAADRVHELALDQRPALDLQAQRHEEGGHDVEIGDREADVVEAPYM
jgi:hypothetical protein